MSLSVPQHSLLERSCQSLRKVRSVLIIPKVLRTQITSEIQASEAIELLLDSGAPGTQA